MANKVLISSARIKVNDKSLSNTDFLIDNIEISLDIKAASTASFSVYNCYDLGKRQFKSNIKNTLCLGAKVEILLGVNYQPSKVFVGYIESLVYKIDNEASIDIVCIDIRRFMMENIRKQMIYKGVKTYEALIKKVMANYSCAVKIDANKADKIEDKYFTQNESDYDFLEKISQKSGRYFTVNLGVAYFLLPKNLDFGSDVILEFGNDLISINQRLRYANKKITVIGKNEGEPSKKIISSVTVKTNSKTKLVTKKPVMEIVMDTDINSGSLAKDKANRLKESVLMEAINGAGMCIGNTKIVPGAKIKIKKFDSSLMKKKYLVIRVTHSYSVDDGFYTSFELGGEA